MCDVCGVVLCVCACVWLVCSADLVLVTGAIRPGEGSHHVTTRTGRLAEEEDEAEGLGTDLHERVRSG